jgi:hypothetical protein
MMKINARQFEKNCRAFFMLGLLATGPAVAAPGDDLRVAAVIVREPGSMVLIEDAGGTQSWFKVGDTLDDLQVTEIDDDGATLRGADSIIRLLLRGDDSKRHATAVVETAPPPAEQSRTFRYMSLISEIESDSPSRGEKREQAIARSINSALGLSDEARITEIEHVEVASAAEARAELRRRLSANETVRVSIAGDEHVKVLYVTPDQ